MGVTFTQGIHEIIEFAPFAARKYYFDALCYSGFILWVVSLYYQVKQREKILMFITGLTTFLFVLFMIKAGRTFALHSYYIVPFTPIMALGIGWLITQLPKRFTVLLLSIVLIENIANAQHDLFYKKSEAYKLQLESIADSVTLRNDLVVINGTDNPQELYFSHRKGWTITSEEMMQKTFTDSLVKLGCKWAIVNKLNQADSLYYPIVFDNEFYRIYRLGN